MLWTAKQDGQRRSVVPGVFHVTDASVSKIGSFHRFGDPRGLLCRTAYRV
jgi:hypothetical protein